MKRINRSLFNSLLVFLLVCAISCKKIYFPINKGINDNPINLAQNSGTLTNQVPKFAAADIIQIDSGRLLAVFSNEINAGDKNDMFKCLSYDGGKTWTTVEKLSLKNPGWELLSSNLLKVYNRIFLVIQRRKIGVGAWEGAIPVCSYSDDNGHTWSKLRLMLKRQEKEFIISNGRNFTRTRSGRLIIPVSHGALKHTVGILYSDNNGLTWKEGDQSFGGSNIKAAKFAEPTVAQLKDGRLIMLIRTDLGWIYKCYSNDDGKTWSEAVATTLQSPWCAHTMRITPEGYILVIYSRGPNSSNSGWPRNNLTFAVSFNNGDTWKDSKIIIDHTDPQYYVMQPTITFVGDKILISYLHISPWPVKFTDNCIRTAIYNRSDIIR